MWTSTYRSQSDISYTLRWNDSDNLQFVDNVFDDGLPVHCVKE
jgi:hypothetical protein